MSSDTCSDAKARIEETCCYSTCDLCKAYGLNWDVFVNYNGTDMSCNVADGTEHCDALKADYSGTCCYASPTTSCQLCNHGDIFFDVNDNAQVDFNGPTTCVDVASFMSCRIEDKHLACKVSQTSLFKECCYESCNLAGKEGTYPD
jgi:hypothetical protein